MRQASSAAVREPKSRDLPLGWPRGTGWTRSCSSRIGLRTRPRASSRGQRRRKRCRFESGPFASVLSWSAVVCRLASFPPDPIHPFPELQELRSRCRTFQSAPRFGGNPFFFCSSHSACERADALPHAPQVSRASSRAFLLGGLVELPRTCAAVALPVIVAALVALRRHGKRNAAA